MTVEELRGMTHEDLVRRVQELEEANEKLAEEKNTWYKSWSDLKQKFDHFKNAVKSIVRVLYCVCTGCAVREDSAPFLKKDG